MARPAHRSSRSSRSSRSPLLRVIAACAVGLLAGIAAPTVAQSGEPAAITGLTSSRAPFTADEQARIRAFGTHWLAQLSRDGASAAEIDDARRRLLEPLRGRGQSELFLTEYGQVIQSGLVQIIDADSSAHRTSNAIVVLSRLGTERALDALLDRASVRATSQVHIRLGAARGLKDLVRLSDLTRVSVRKRQQAARRLRDAAALEPDPGVLRHLLEAIFRCDRSDIEMSIRQELHGSLVEAMRAVGDGARRDPLLLEAVNPVILSVLQEFLRLDPAAQPPISRTMLPGLVRLVEVYRDVAWDLFPTGSEDRARLGRQIARVERCLERMGPFVAPGRVPAGANLERAWVSGDRDRFNRDLEAWRAILN